MDRAIKIAGYSALVGSVLQCFLTLIQLGRLTVPYVIVFIRGHDDLARTWPWIVALSWLLFAVTLIGLQQRAAPPQDRLGRVSLAAAGLGISLVALALVVLLVAAPNNCPPHTLCIPSSPMRPFWISVVRSVGAAGALLMSAGFLTHAAWLLVTRRSPRWSIIFLVLGAGGAYTFTLLDHLTGFPESMFYVDPTTALLGAAWAASWIALSVRIFSVERDTEAVL